jgi:Tol biopolymer transport system component/tRNA A-37 threonylcarbamoyl transferase component Bud32
VKRWTELKEAFWQIVDSDPATRTRRLEVLASTDPELHRHLDQLLAADARGEPLLDLLEPAAAGPSEEVPSRLGLYEITDVIGAGGMGQVYRARDSRLHRDVAIKVLPRAVTSDRSRLVPFEREARILATLNHPHIAQVYGLEESTGTPALVMELVDGPSLERFIASHSEKRISVARVLAIARQIADGLDAAHEKGIVHSDLKPGNIALTAAGDVKILDFGIARNVAEAVPLESGTTLAGAGTPAYMSPEQASGSPVDKRTDIWAFGCILYELLTGHRPVVSATTANGLATAAHPDLTALPADTPPSIRSLIRRCLQPDPKHRLRDIGDARFAIDEVLDQATEDRGGRPAALPASLTRNSARRRVLAGIAGGAIVLLGIVALTMRDDSAALTGPLFVSVTLPEGMHPGGTETLTRSADSWFAISPDGKQIAVVAADGGGRPRLWVRELRYGVFRPLPETDDASYPFWSPDSARIAFVVGTTLKSIAIAGGTPVTLADGGFLAGSWSRDGVILFAPAASSALHRIDASGESLPVTTLNRADGEVQHSYPAFLPDGRHFLYAGTGNKSAGALAARGVYLTSLDGNEPPTLLLPGATRAEYASGYLLFLRNGQLMAQAFDADALALRGNSFPLAAHVRTTTTGATGVTGTFSAAENVLVYQTRSAIRTQPVWIDQSGRQLATLGAVGDYGDVALSPDGARLAVSVFDPAASSMNLWIHDAQGGGSHQLTSERTDEFAPVWSPDGTQLLFSVLSKGAVNLFITNVSGKGAAVPLHVDSLGLGRFANDWSGNNRFIMYVGGGRAIGQSDLWIADVSAPHNARPLLNSPAVETHGQVHPQSRWFAYTSNETGRLEVYIDRFPQRNNRRQVSRNGGGWPRWARNGQELYYLEDGQMMAAAVRLTPDGIDIDPPRRLFPVRPRPPIRLDAYAYDVADDHRFIVNTVVEQAASNAITALFNWTEALED